VVQGCASRPPGTAYQVYTQCTGIEMERACRCAGHCYQKIRPPVRTKRYVFVFACGFEDAVFGSIGSVETFLVDFEQAAIAAIQDVFPAVTVKGCTFHFRHTVVRHLQQEGLRSTYDSTTEHPDVRLWMRRVMAMSMLPKFAIPLC